jgi:hypothetical protein
MTEEKFIVKTTAGSFSSLVSYHSIDEKKKKVKE